MEKVIDKQKYVQEDSRRKKVQRWVTKNALWILLFFGFSGGIGIYVLYAKSIASFSMPQVDYDRIVNKKDYDKKKGPIASKLDHMREKLSGENTEGGRYQQIISGKDLISSVDYGSVTYSEKPLLESDTMVKEPADSAPLQVQEENPVVDGRNLSGQKKAPTRMKPARKSTTVLREETRIDSTSSTQVDTIEISDSVSPFNTIKIENSKDKIYTLAYVHGEQELVSGAFVKLRLGEDLMYDNRKILKNTIFNGLVNISSNVVSISIDRINHYNVNFAVFDNDYSKGIIISATKGQDLQNALDRSAYRSTSRAANSLPYDVVRDVSSSIVQAKRRKQAVIPINDGYQVYISNTK